MHIAPAYVSENCLVFIQSTLNIIPLSQVMAVLILFLKGTEASYFVISKSGLTPSNETPLPGQKNTPLKEKTNKQKINFINKTETGQAQGTCKG